MHMYASLKFRSASASVYESMFLLVLKSRYTIPQQNNPYTEQRQLCPTKLQYIYNRWMKVLNLIVKGKGDNQLVERCRGKSEKVEELVYVNTSNKDDNTVTNGGIDEHDDSSEEEDGDD